MNNAVTFLVESGVSLALLSAFYLLFLRKETCFRLNRIFLLASLVFSIVLPFLKFRIYGQQAVMLPEITVTPYKNLLEAVTVYGHSFLGTMVHAVSASNLIIFIYLAGLFYFLGRLIFRIVQILLMIRRNPVQQTGSYKFVSVNKTFSPFSFLNYIFINPENQLHPGYDKMIVHETEHIKQGHSVDILLLELLTAFQWFNPFLWMFKRAIRENHEFLADRAVLRAGIATAQYKQLLLNQVIGFQPEIANNFNSSLIKKRIKMISKIKSSKFANVKILSGIVIAMILVLAFACEQKDTVEMPAVKSENLPPEPPVKGPDQNGQPIFYVVEQMPQFPGGDMALKSFISKAVKYPVVAQKDGIQGKVYVSFVISKDGSVTDARIARSVDPSLDNEALRVINSLPKWKPGTQRGIPVNVSFTVPINFVLQ